MHRSLLLLLSLALTSCANLNLKPYVDADSADAASITFVNESSQTIALYIYEGAERCSAMHAAEWLEFEESITHKVPSHKPLAYAMGWERGDLASGSTRCMVLFTHQTDAGGSYRVGYRDAINGCRAYTQAT